MKHELEFQHNLVKITEEHFTVLYLKGYNIEIY